MCSFWRSWNWQGKEDYLTTFILVTISYCRSLPVFCKFVIVKSIHSSPYSGIIWPSFFRKWKCKLACVCHCEVSICGKHKANTSSSSSLYPRFDQRDLNWQTTCGHMWGWGMQLCSGVDENAVGACAQLVFAPVDVAVSDDVPLLPSGFRVIPLDCSLVVSSAFLVFVCSQLLLMQSGLYL